MTESDISLPSNLLALLNDPYEFGCIIRMCLMKLDHHQTSTPSLSSKFLVYIKDVQRPDYHRNTDFSVRYEGVAPRVVLNHEDSIELLSHLYSITSLRSFLTP